MATKIRDDDDIITRTVTALNKRRNVRLGTALNALREGRPAKVHLKVLFDRFNKTNHAAGRLKPTADQIEKQIGLFVSAASWLSIHLNYQAFQNIILEIAKIYSIYYKLSPGETAGQSPAKNNDVKDKDAITNDQLLTLLRERRVPSELCQRVKLAMDETTKSRRPMWDDRRTQPPDLSKLTAPAYMLKVYADIITKASDGFFEVNKPIIRDKDSSLMDAVEGYVKARRKYPDLGDARNIRFILSHPAYNK